MFETERGDVLLWVQFTLIREDQRRGPAGRARQDRIEVPAALPRTDTDGGSFAGASRTPSLPQAPVLVDAATGARTLVALRRDLGFEGSPPPSEDIRSGLIALSVLPLSAIRSVAGDQAAQRILQAVVEVAPFALPRKARLYRSGPDELALLLDETGPGVAEHARRSLNVAVERILAVRHLPSIQLILRPMVVPTAHEAEARTAAFPLAAAV